MVWDDVSAAGVLYSTPYVSIRLTESPEAVRVSIAGEVDVSELGALGDVVERVHEAARDGTRPVVVDLTDVTFFGSTGVRFVVALRDQFCGCGSTVQVEGATDLIRRVFKIVGLGEVISESGTS
jgi:anti-anti-sigma factor